MIIFRYLARELIYTMLAISSVVLLITMSARFVKYLAEAAAGKMDASVLFAVMGYRLPSFLELIIPLGFFLGVLFAYGKLYMESEMTVLNACGFSRRRLVGYTLVPAFFIALFVGFMSLVVSPKGAYLANELLMAQKTRTDVEKLSPATFQKLQKGQAVAYAKSLDAENKVLEGVFLAQLAEPGTDEGPSIVMAKTGEQYIDPDTGDRFLLLKDGHRFRGVPGTLEMEVAEFDRFAQILPKIEASRSKKHELASRPTKDLIGSDNPEDIASLQWRISIPLLVLIVTLMAVPLSKTNPRQGRYITMIPAILLYFVYLGLLIFARGKLEKGELAPELGVWWVHGIFIALGVLFIFMPDWLQANKRRRLAKSANTVSKELDHA